MVLKQPFVSIFLPFNLHLCVVLNWLQYDFIPPIMPVVESVDPASWRQGLRKTGIVLVPSKGEKSMVRFLCAQVYVQVAK